jgi:C_GCAxxG_C_C family probable redox protein
MDDNELQQRIQTAVSYLDDRNYTCAQSVACAFADYTDLDPDIIYRLSEGCGGGLGTMGNETCGTLIGTAMILGCVTSGGMDQPASKGRTFEKLRPIVARFKEKNGSTYCGELQGLTGSAALRSCEGCVADACTMLAEALDGGEA